MIPLLEHEEHVEQAHLFRVLRERLPENIPLQDLLAQLRDEVLATTKLPMAMDFLLGELRHEGVIGSAMERLPHYFTAFQTYVIQEAEREPGRFDMRTAVEILRFEAEYRAKGPTRPGAFLYQFEALCRNRLRYETGLDAMAKDPAYDEDWRDWIQTVRRQIGLVDFADMVYVRSQYYWDQRATRLGASEEVKCPILFGEKEGRIALANRRKDPLFLFSALQRHLGYPKVPRPTPMDDTRQLIPQLLRRMDRLETRIKLFEDEQREGIDLTQFYSQSKYPAGEPPSP